MWKFRYTLKGGVQTLSWNEKCVRRITKIDNWLHHVCPSVRMIDRMRQVGSHWGGCSWKLKFQYFSKVYLENSKSDKNGGYLHEDKCTFLIISRPFLLRMTSVSDKFCTEIQNTHFRFNKVIFCFENLAVYEIIWKESDRP